MIGNKRGWWRNKIFKGEEKMKRKILSVLLTLVLVLSFSLMTVVPVEAAKPADKGFDQWGYNYQARIFNGLFGNSDENRPGDNNPDTYLGSSTNSYGYKDTDGNFHEILVDVAGSHLVMKWSEVWHMAVFGPDGIRYNNDEEPWGQGAWCTNHVEGTGTIYDIDGTTIIYQGHLTILSKIKWVGDTTGYTNPIWGEMAVIQKVVSKQGAVFLEIPCGLGPVSP